MGSLTFLLNKLQGSKQKLRRAQGLSSQGVTEPATRPALLTLEASRSPWPGPRAGHPVLDVELAACVRQPPGLYLGLLTEIRKTFTPWSSVSMAVMRMLFSLALSICIWAHSLVLRISRRLPWVRITATSEDVSPARPHPTPGKQTHLQESQHPREESRDSLPPAHLPSSSPGTPATEVRAGVEVVPGRGFPGKGLPRKGAS